MLCTEENKCVNGKWSLVLKTFCDKPFMHVYSKAIRFESTAGADAINISGLLNPKKLGNFKNQML